MADTSLRLPGNAVGGAISAPRRAAPPSWRGRAGGAVRRWRRAVSPAEAARYAWAALWLPYWFSSDVPAPHLPTRDPKPPAVLGPGGGQVVRTLDRLCRRVWLLWVLTLVV